MLGYIISALIISLDVLVAVAGYPSLATRGIIYCASVLIGGLAFEFQKRNTKPRLPRAHRSGLNEMWGTASRGMLRRVSLATSLCFSMVLSASLIVFFVFRQDLALRAIFSAIMAIIIVIQLWAGMYRATWGRLGLVVEFAIFAFLGTLELRALHPFYYGDLDPIVHASFVDNLTRTGTISSDTLGIYVSFPVFHVLSSEISQLVGTGSFESMFICVLLASAGGLIAFYVLAKRVLGGILGAAVASLLLATGFEWLYIAISPRPQSLSMIFFIFVLSILSVQGRFGLSRASVFALISVVWILTHQISVLFAISFVAFSFVLDKLGFAPSNALRVSLNSLLYLGVLLAGYWMVISSFGNWLVPVVAQRLTGFTEYQYSQLYNVGGLSDLSFLINTVGFAPLLALLVLCFLRLATHDVQVSDIRSWSTLALAGAVFYFPNPLWLSPTFAGLGLDRLGRILEPIIVLGASLTLLRLLKGARSNAHSQEKVAMVAAIVVVSLVAGFTASNGLRPNSDSLTDLLGIRQPRLFFDADEVSAVTFVTMHLGPKATINSDVPTSAFLLSLGYIKATPFSVYENGTLVNSSGYSIVRIEAYGNGGILVLQAESANSFAPLIRAYSRITDLPDAATSPSSVIYSSGSTLVFMSTGL
ncbi:MAG TPA: hypothetical protein VEO96_00400 [Thermoplasmata archaeon]|nr:hypothetical protein [Thermoplasmata archaeon]